MYLCPFAACYRAARIRLVGFFVLCIITLCMLDGPPCRDSSITADGPIWRSLLTPKYGSAAVVTASLVTLTP